MKRHCRSLPLALASPSKVGKVCRWFLQMEVELQNAQVGKPRNCKILHPFTSLYKKNDDYVLELGEESMGTNVKNKNGNTTTPIKVLLLFGYLVYKATHIKKLPYCC